MSPNSPPAPGRRGCSEGDRCAERSRSPGLSQSSFYGQIPRILLSGFLPCLSNLEPGLRFFLVKNAVPYSWHALSWEEASFDIEGTRAKWTLG